MAHISTHVMFRRGTSGIFTLNLITCESNSAIRYARTDNAAAHASRQCHALRGRWDARGRVWEDAETVSLAHVTPSPWLALFHTLPLSLLLLSPFFLSLHPNLGPRLSFLLRPSSQPLPSSRTLSAPSLSLPRCPFGHPASWPTRTAWGHGTPTAIVRS